MLGGAAGSAPLPAATTIPPACGRSAAAAASWARCGGRLFCANALCIRSLVRYHRADRQALQQYNTAACADTDPHTCTGSFPNTSPKSENTPNAATAIWNFEKVAGLLIAASAGCSGPQPTTKPAGSSVERTIHSAEPTRRGVSSLGQTAGSGCTNPTHKIFSPP